MMIKAEKVKLFFPPESFSFVNDSDRFQTITWVKLEWEKARGQLEVAEALWEVTCFSSKKMTTWCPILLVRRYGDKGRWTVLVELFSFETTSCKGKDIGPIVITMSNLIQFILKKDNVV